ncbi:heme-thiolate peroxidase [Xylaria curta]|uniref:Heme-thiolate peroxidase n=1 Tax=Xylaria curta TaxID=42375 RepID=A0ACC1P3E1_9PEZI|nr:heme-thiolate peroxidase [Xylaria curta]
MKAPLLATTLALGLALGRASELSYPQGHPWAPARRGDLRGPCPMMNTLANHGYLQRDGRNITRENAVKALADGLNFNPTLANIMFDQAIIANPEPNATYFTLDHLNQHNVLEHDASLSRADAYFGNNHIFNQTVFDETRQYWVAPILNASMLANSKVARMISSKAFNPTYTFTLITEEFSLGEVVAPVIAFGDTDAVIVNRTLVEYFFENERLPTSLGWKRRDEIVSLNTILKATSAIRNATSLFTDSDASLSKRKLTANLH